MRFSSLARFALHARPVRLVATAAVLASGIAGCVTPDPTNTTASSPVDSRVRDVDFKHEECEPNADSKTVDVNGDGPADIIHVMKGGREVCRIVDLNFDRSVDVYIFYDDKGQERRREADFDRDGRPDQISIYKNGQLAEHHRETNFDDKIDTWDYYENSVLVRRERDSDGDAILDQWWTFYDPARPKCATVARDQNADGKPDPSTQVDLCGTGYVSPNAWTPPPGATPSATPSATLPTMPTPTAGPAVPGGVVGGSPGPGAGPGGAPSGAPSGGAPSPSGGAPSPSGGAPSPAPSPSPAPKP